MIVATTVIANLRRANLRSLREILPSTQTDFGAVFWRSQKDISELERGVKTISEDLARKIERELALPPGWMDRDNVGVFLSRDEHELIGAVRSLSDGVRERLFDLARELKASK